MTTKDLKNLDTVLDSLDFDSDLYKSISLAIETLHNEHQTIVNVHKVLNDNLMWLDGISDHVMSDIKDCIKMLEDTL